MTLAALRDSLDLQQANRELASAGPEEIIRWALDLGLRPFASTSFGPRAAVMLHLVSSVDPSVPVVWVDTGYNLRDTYVVAQRLIDRLPLNLKVFTPRMTAERWNALNGGIPQLHEADLHAEFTRVIKLEPFDRAISELGPQLWLTGIRREETSYRRGLDVVSREERRGMLRVAPVFHWSEADMDAYLSRHELPSCRHYFDPTKALDDRECGLHTGL